ncbi:MAG: hypothetical protein KAW45_03465 [Thermoplasmatales archaeon]|nr:hypothetical protein [Thermoplasmatales archaeon]
MKREETAKKMVGLTIWVIFLSIIGLILISFLPWVSVTEDDWIKEDLYFNFEMMEQSDNEQISIFANELNFMSLLFWVLIILGFLTLIGIIIHAFGKTMPTVIVLLTLGIITLIISILIFYLQITFIRTIESVDNISLAALAPYFHYAYIPLIFSLVLLIFSIRYTVVVITNSITKFKDYKKQKKESEKEKPRKKKSKKLQKKESETKIKKSSQQEKTILKKTPLELEKDKKRIEMEQWITGEVKSMEKQSKPEKQQISISEKEEIPDELDKEIKESADVKDKDQSGPFPSEEIKIESDKTDEEPSASQSFEEALSSAIQKRHDENGQKPSDKEEDLVQEIKSDDPSEIKEEKIPEKEEETDKNTFNVRCPKCRYIFVAESGEGITKIKCPNCGKEGNIQ